MIRRLGAITVMLVCLLVACGIPDNGQVSTIQSKDLRQLGDTLPSTTTSTIPATSIVPSTTTTVIDTATTIATEDVTLYFIISGGQLKGYPRSLAKPATVAAVVEALQGGPPSGEEGVGIRSAVPTREEALIKPTDDDSGIAKIDLPPGFFEQIPPDDQLLAIGQIVLTVTEVGGIGQVLFTENGQPRQVPRGGGGLTDGTEPLARRDFAELLNPPATTTTTTTTTTITTTTVATTTA